MHDQSHTETFEFRGNAKDYFGIWIVNVLLSIVTFGIYSAWAKVRTKKYFYQNTYVAGRNFDYHATGGQIFKGRLIVGAALVVYSLLATFSPAIALILALLVFAIGPVLIINSAKFNARNSSWANVRFNFDCKTGDAYWAYMAMPMLVALSLYTCLPFLTRAMNRFGINGHSLGKTRFSFESPIGPFYKAFLAAAVFFIAGFVGFFWVIFDPTTLHPPTPESMVLGYLILLPAFVIGGILYQAMIRNHIVGNTKLGPHGFASTFTVAGLFKLAFTNLLITVCSLGLLLPWAQVRMHRYFAANTHALPDGTIDDFHGEIIKDQGAIGDAYSDIEGIDLGLSI